MKTMAQVAQRMTADEYLAMPCDERRTQLVEGEVVLNESRFLHQIVLADIQRALDRWSLAEPGRGGVVLPVDVRIDDRNVFGPDLLWYAGGRVPERHDDPPYALPEIAVEVRSPSTWRYDIGAKKAAYERAGLKELWLVDTSGEVVLVFRRSCAGSASFDQSLELTVADELTSPLLPGFALALRVLFP